MLKPTFPSLRKAAFLTGGFLFLILANVIAIAYVYKAGGDARQDKILLAFNDEQREIAEKAIKEITDISAASNKVTQEILRDAQKDDNIAIGTTLRNQLERMRRDREICPNGCKD